MLNLPPARNELLGPLLPPPLLSALEQDQPSQTTIAEACAQSERLLEAVIPFVPPPVAALRLKEPTPERTASRYTNGTMLLVNLGGFAELAAELVARGRQGSEELSLVLNQLFSLLSDELHAHGGGIISFSGDGLLALFDASNVQGAHAALACAAALGMQRRMREWTTTAFSTTMLRLRIGIHTGQMFAAEVGDSQQMQLLVTGHTLNRVAVAHEAAAPGDIVISEATAQALGPAIVEPRAKGFSLLRQLTVTPAKPIPQRRSWQPGIPSATTLDDILSRIRTLEPYLPAGLPPRLLADGGGEFRPVTVLVANVYGFSKLLELLEPLAVLDGDTTVAGRMLQSYYMHIQALVHRFGGTIDRIHMASVGDQFVALFGAPIAHEDDSRRATQAALALPEALAAINREVIGLVRELIARYPHQRALARLASIALRHRVGIASGVVFAGIVGTAERHAYTVLGTTVQLASQLMHLAQDGEILLDAYVQAAVQQIVETQALPALAFPATDTLLPVHRALQLRIGASRLLAHGAPLVGRQPELDQLHQIAQRALAIEGAAGQVVAMVGDAGSGKSRLVAELLRTVRTTLPHVEILQDVAQSYEQTTPYAIWTRLLRTTLQPILLDDASPAPAVVEQYLSELVGDVSRFSPLLAPLLHLSLPSTDLTEALTPEQRRDRLHDLLAELFLAVARRTPLVLVLDDLHWADASTLAVVQRLATGMQDVSLLLLLAYRSTPSLAESWRTLPYSNVLPIKELDQAASEALLAALLGGKPPAALKPLIERTQGTPFFLEETVRFLLQSGALERTAAGVWLCTQPETLTDVPITVEQLITARLDRLEAPQRALLEVAAVIGRRFDGNLLATALGSADDQVEQLSALVHASLLEHDPDTGGVYLFKQGLTRDVAYQSLLFARKRQVHGAVAAAMQLLYRDTLTEHQAVLGQHYLGADDLAAAFPCFVAAAHQAQQRYANHEAVSLYRQAILIGPWLTQTNDQAAMTLGSDLFSGLGDVQTLIGDYVAARKAYEQALHLLQGLPQATGAWAANLTRRIATTFEQQARYTEAREQLGYAHQLLGPNDQQERAHLDGDAGWLAFIRGDLDEAEQLLGQAMASALHNDDRALQARIFNRLAGVHFRRGDRQQAQHMLAQSLHLGRQLNDQMAVARALINLGNVAQEQADWAKAEQCYAESKDIYTRHGDVRGQIMTTLNGAVVALARGRLSTADGALATVYTLAQRIGDTFHMALARMNQGRAAFYAGDLGQARRYLLAAERCYRQTHSHVSDRSDVAGYLGRVAFRQGKVELAQRLATLALALATQGQNAVAQLHAQQLRIVVYAHQRQFAPAAALLADLQADDVANDPYEQAMLLVIEALLLRAQGQAEATVQKEQQARQHFDQLGVPLVLQRFV